MIKLRYGYLLTMLVAVVMTILAELSASPAVANPGLRVSGAILVTDVSAGETLTHNMTVGIEETDPPMDIVVQVGGIGQSLDGSYQLLDASKDTSQYSARQFITVDRELFHLDAGASQDLTVTVRIPGDVRAGGRYAIINISAKPVSQGGVGFITAVNVPIYLTIQDKQLIHTGKITELNASEAVSGKPIDIFTTFQNTGNHHFKIRGEVTISDSQGKLLDTIYEALTSSSIIPTMSQQLKASYICKEELTPGVYTIKSRVMLEDGTLLDEAEGSFEAKEPYVPPLPPASITLTPGSAAILKTADERISISFPRGAVISQVEISLQNYPPEQIPAQPTDFQLGTTCFRINGLTGLLAKEATVTLKYTADDLYKAGGDASRLKLARWDEASNQWTVLKTRVDKVAMTLSTSTSQLSIWAVVVAPPPGINWVVIGGAAAGVIIIASVIFFLATSRRG